MVQVFLESMGTLEGDMLVSGVQGAAARRMAAVWNELEERHRQGEMVKGVLPTRAGFWLLPSRVRSMGVHLPACPSLQAAS